MSLKIITTADGSHSILNETLQETYHSVHGAIQESIHVFITNGLTHAAQHSKGPLTVLEVGFGTGLNALLSLQWANENQRKIHFFTLESNALPPELWSQLNYAERLMLSEEYAALHQAGWNTDHQLSSCFTLRKISSTLEAVELPAMGFDLIFYDAFAPSRQPELWTLMVIEKTIRYLKPGGIWVTYCAKGQLKRDLKALGMSVQTLPGPPGKKEMVRALKGH